MKRKTITALATLIAAFSAATVGHAASAAPAAGPGTWTFEGKADLHDSGAVDVKVRSIAGAPRSHDLVRRLLIGREVLLVNTPTRIVDAQGRGVAFRGLNDAIVRIKGTLLPAAQWRYDLDGEATPTVRVSQIVVLQLDFD